MNRWLIALLVVLLLASSVVLNLVLWRQIRDLRQQVAGLMPLAEEKIKQKPVLILPPLPGGTTDTHWRGPDGEANPQEVIDRLVARISQLENEKNDLWTQAHSTRPATSLVSVNFSTARKIVWMGWSLGEGLPAAGGGYRLLGPLWAGAWIRPGRTWDGGPTIGTSW